MNLSGFSRNFSEVSLAEWAFKPCVERWDGFDPIGDLSCVVALVGGFHLSRNQNVTKGQSQPQNMVPLCMVIGFTILVPIGFDDSRGSRILAPKTMVYNMPMVDKRFFRILATQKSRKRFGCDFCVSTPVEF